MNRAGKFALGLMAVLAVGATAPQRARNWGPVVAVTPSGSHVYGNPQAKVKLTEWMSYTCPHCAHFESEGAAPIRLQLVMPGKLQFEIRHLVRDPIDMTVALLANCGTPDRFLMNHIVFLRTQSTWIQPLTNPSQAQRVRWETGDYATRSRNIAGDFHLYDIMETRGYSRVQVDRCLADKAMADRLTAQIKDAANRGVSGTPSFAIDGVILAGTYNWDLLQPQLAVRF